MYSLSDSKVAFLLSKVVWFFKFNPESITVETRVGNVRTASTKQGARLMRYRSMADTIMGHGFTLLVAMK